jgi:hypothetical protein
MAPTSPSSTSAPPLCEHKQVTSSGRSAVCLCLIKCIILFNSNSLEVTVRISWARASALSGWSLAFIGNASAHKAEAKTYTPAEAFSIRRLEGSRWRLRRTRQLWKLNASLVLLY